MGLRKPLTPQRARIVIGTIKFYEPELPRRPRLRTKRPGLDWVRHPGARRYLWQVPSRAFRRRKTG